MRRLLAGLLELLQLLLERVLVQGIGLAGSACGMGWPLFRSRVGMLLAQLATNLCFAVHYALLGAATGGAMNLLAAAQVGAAIPLGTRPGFRLVYLAVLPFIALLLAGLLITSAWPALALFLVR